MGYVAESKDFNNYHLLMAKTLEGQARMSPLQK
jgi:hypothetical protein